MNKIDDNSKKINKNKNRTTTQKVPQLALEVKNPPANAGNKRLWFSPLVQRSPGDGNGNPLQYSCLENPMDRGAWPATVHGVIKDSDTTVLLGIWLVWIIYLAQTAYFISSLSTDTIINKYLLGICYMTGTLCTTFTC